MTFQLNAQVGVICQFTPQQGGYPEESINTSKCSFITLLPPGHPPRDPHSARAGVLVFRKIIFYFINTQLTFCCELKWIKPLIWELRSFPVQQFSSNLCNRVLGWRRERTIPSVLYDTSVQERRDIQVGYKTLQQDAATVWKDVALEIWGWLVEFATPKKTSDKVLHLKQSICLEVTSFSV